MTAEDVVGWDSLPYQSIIASKITGREIATAEIS
jgi:hypothetical protein